MTLPAQKIWVAYETLFAADLVAEFAKVWDNYSLLYIDDYSANVAQFRAFTIPNESSLPTTGAGEVEVLRGEFRRMKGSQYPFDIPSHEVTVGTYGMYSTLAAAIAASKSKIKLVSDLTVSDEQEWTLSNGIIDGQGYKLICDTAATDSILVISGDENIVRDLIIEGQHTTGTTVNGLEMTGDKNRITGSVFQNGAGGTITNAINDSGSDNIYDIIVEDKAGTITNVEA